MRSTPSQEFDSIQVVIHYFHEDLRSNRSDAKHEEEVQPEPAQHPEVENSNDVNGTPREQGTVSPFIILFYVILSILLFYFMVFLLFSFSSLLLLHSNSNPLIISSPLSKLGTLIVSPIPLP